MEISNNFFFIVGVAKGGTTVLSNFLNQHPEICMSSIKEPDYFSQAEIQNSELYYGTKPVQTEQEYQSLFDCEKGSKVHGEASVSYFFYPQCADRIKDFAASAKVILVLRNPIDRAYSHFMMDKRLGFVKHSFDEIVEDPKSFPKHFEQYIEQGKYLSSLQKYRDVFGKNLLLLEWSRRLEDSLPQVYEFLKLEAVDVLPVEGNSSKQPNGVFLQSLYAKPKVRQAIKSILPKRALRALKEKTFTDQGTVVSEHTIQKLKNYYASDLEQVRRETGFALPSKFDSLS